MQTENGAFRIADSVVHISELLYRKTELLSSVYFGNLSYFGSFVILHKKETDIYELFELRKTAEYEKIDLI